jgi:glycosyltransferase involved in cell wall biosynthesis
MTTKGSAAVSVLAQQSENTPHETGTRPSVLEVRQPRVSVVVPAINEAKNLPYVFRRMPADVFEVVLVDGGSVDGTVEVACALRPDVRVVQQTRKGKGNALACGFAAARGDVIVMIDADGSMDPVEIQCYVAALMTGADFVKGSRFSVGGGSADITYLRRLGNRMLNLIFNTLYRTTFSDLCYGFSAFWAAGVPHFRLDPAIGDDPSDTKPRWGDGFEIETLLNVRAVQAGMRVVEVASYEYPRIHGGSNLSTMKDGMRVLRTILRERMSRPAKHAVAAPVVMRQRGSSLKHLGDELVRD